MPTYPQLFRQLGSYMLLLILLLFLPVAALAQLKPDYTDPITGMEFVLIKGGTFSMGDSSENSKRYEKLVHQVSINDFYLGKYEVTFEQFALFCEETGREKPDDNGWGRGKRPVINITWDDAVSFSLWLKKKTGLPYRLPSESEWEYANRAGTTTRYWWGDQFDTKFAACCGRKSPQTTKTADVGSYPPNPFGLYDTISNVWEWTMDNQHDSYEGAPIDGSPWFGGTTFRKMTRGGSYLYSEDDMFVFSRCWDIKQRKHKDIGFRLALDATDQLSKSKK